MRRRRRMDDKCLCIPNIRQIACQPQAVDDVSADLCVTALNAEVQPTLERVRAEETESFLVVLVGLQPGV